MKNKNILLMLAAALSVGSVRANGLSSPLVFTGEVKCGACVESPSGSEQTFACWFKALGQGNGDKPYDRIIQTPDWFLHTISEPDEVRGLQFGFTDAAGRSRGIGGAGDAVFGVWQHVAVTFSDKTGYRVYVNGREAARREYGNAMIRGLPKSLRGGLACLGNCAPGANRPFKGEILGAAFWPRALSADEVFRLAAKDPEGKPVRRVKIAMPMADDLVPVVDISAETNRHTVIAAGTKDRYEGHPTTLLADDGRTMFCVWTTGHGGPCGPMARSGDGGRSWTRIDDRLPAVYGCTHRNCPVLQKLKGPDGRVRYFIYSAKAKEGTGLGIMMSEDLGETWVELPCQPQLSAGMPPTGVMELKNGDIALFGQRFKARDKAKDRPTDDQAVWMAISKDGGRTYGEMRNVMVADKRNLCEPCCLRSPDGKSLLLIARENRHKGRSMMSFSHDEGRTWTDPVDTPWALTGDRHEGVLLPDGRYVIAFRDQAVGSETRGQFMAWVGTFDDLVNGRNGQYRIHLLHHHGRKGVWPGNEFDTGYPGVELLPDGTIVCTTYTRHFDDDRQSSVVCTRFRIEETDARLGQSACTSVESETPPFVQIYNEDDSHFFYERGDTERLRLGEEMLREVLGRYRRTVDHGRPPCRHALSPVVSVRMPEPSGSAFGRGRPLRVHDLHPR